MKTAEIYLYRRNLFVLKRFELQNIKCPEHGGGAVFDTEFSENIFDVYQYEEKGDPDSEMLLDDWSDPSL